MYSHDDRLAALSENLPLGRKLHAVHQAMRDDFPFLARIAVAAYDPGLGTLKTFLASSGPGEPLQRYEARLEDAPSLAETLRVGRPRVVNDLALFEKGEHDHTRAIRRGGYRASYTMPLRFQGTFWGFVFFNSDEAGRFTEAALRAIDPFGHLIAALTVADLLAVRVLSAAVRSAHAMTLGPSAAHATTSAARTAHAMTLGSSAARTAHAMTWGSSAAHSARVANGTHPNFLIAFTRVS